MDRPLSEHLTLTLEPLRITDENGLEVTIEDYAVVALKLCTLLESRDQDIDASVSTKRLQSMAIELIGEITKRGKLLTMTRGGAYSWDDAVVPGQTLGANGKPMGGGCGG